MSFAVRLSTDLVSVEAGATSPLTIEVVNRSEEGDRFELEVEGLDPEWTAVPVPAFMVGPGDTASEKVFFRTPRTPESLAGNYPFVIKVRSLASGEQRTAQGVLQIQPYHHISAEISPKKGVVATMRHHNRFTVTLMNLGNTEHTVQLSASDPEEALAFDFEQAQVTIAPGQQRDVAVTAQPATKRMISNTRLYGFSVTARSMDVPAVASAAHAQLEQRPTFTVAGLIFWLVVIAVGIGWYEAMPRPPTIEFGVSRAEVTLGQTVTVWWRTQYSQQVHVEANGVPVYDGIQQTGQIEYTPKRGGEVNLLAYAVGTSRKSPEKEATVNVVVPPPAPLPVIESFSADPTRVRVGESTVFSYKFNDAVVRATLSPLNQELNLNDEKIEIPVNWEGPKTFTVIAENRDHKVAKKSVKVSGFQESEVKVIAFDVSATHLAYPGGLVTVSWQLTDAVHADIKPNVSQTTTEVDPNKGKFDIYLDKSTTFTLVAKDKNNLPVTQTLRVTVDPAPPPPVDSTSGVGPDLPTGAGPH